MHRYMTRGVSLAGGALAAILAAGPVLAEPGFVSGRVSLRAGPGVRYPVVANLRSGEPVDILGCMPRWGWCDIETRGLRGWAPGRSLQVVFENRRSTVMRFGRGLNIPFIDFGVGDYWGEHYRDRPFYNQMPRFGGRLNPDQQPSGSPAPRPRNDQPRIDQPRTERPRAMDPAVANPVEPRPSRVAPSAAPGAERLPPNAQPAVRPDASRSGAGNPRGAAQPSPSGDVGGRAPAAGRAPARDGAAGDRPAGRGPGEGESNDRGSRGER